MTKTEKTEIYKYHRFLDEAGDATLYGKGKSPIVGNEGVSNCFILGMLQINEHLLNIADYFCWAVQRVFEKGEVRYYDSISDQITLVIDLYDFDKYKGNKNYYRGKRKLTKENHIK